MSKLNAFIEEIKPIVKMQQQGKPTSVFNLLKSLFSKKMRFVYWLVCCRDLSAATGGKRTLFFMPVFLNKWCGSKCAFSQAIFGLALSTSYLASLRRCY